MSKSRRESRNLEKAFLAISVVCSHIPAGDPHRHRRLPRRDDDPHAGVATSAHGAASGVHHEADEEPEGAKRIRRGLEDGLAERESSSKTPFE